MNGTPHAALGAAAAAAATAWADAMTGGDRSWLMEPVADGADGTETSRLDQLVEAAILKAVDTHRVNILSEEAGWLDNGSETTLVIDPIDGTGNAAAGIPFSAFTGAIAVGDRFVEGLTVWLDTGRTWWAHADRPSELRTTGQRCVAESIVSLIRPKGDGRGFHAVAARANRVRVLGSSSIEAALVADGRLDAALDAGSDTHRLVDLAAAAVLVTSAGGTLVDLRGELIGFTTDITRRWSGVAAATPELAAELIDIVTGA